MHCFTITWAKAPNSTKPFTLRKKALQAGSFPSTWPKEVSWDWYMVGRHDQMYIKSLCQMFVDLDRSKYRYIRYS